MNREKRQIRSGGLAHLEERLRDGDVRAARALIRQATGPNLLDTRFTETQVRAIPGSSGRLEFNGYASITGEPYELTDWLGTYSEIVNPGSFSRTLGANPDVIFCVNHNWDAIPLARTVANSMQLSEDSTGLLVTAQMDARRADVFALQSAIEGGELDAMSFAFYVTRQLWSPDYTQRDIQEVDMNMGDTSVVTWPANPATTGTIGVRKQQVRALLRTNVPALLLQVAQQEKREGKTLSGTTMEVLQAVLDLIHDADVAVDAAQPLLAELMGVANPDVDDPDADNETDETLADSEEVSLPADSVDKESVSAIASGRSLAMAKLKAHK